VGDKHWVWAAIGLAFLVVTGLVRIVGLGDNAWLWSAIGLTLLVIAAWVYIIYKYKESRRLGVSRWVLLGAVAFLILVTTLLDEAVSDSGWIGFVKLWVLTPIVVLLVAVLVARRFPSAANSEQPSE
jgi:hypothetical protein